MTKKEISRLRKRVESFEKINGILELKENEMTKADHELQKLKDALTREEIRNAGLEQENEGVLKEISNLKKKTQV